MFGGEGSQLGLIPRAAESLFQSIAEMQERGPVKLSVFVSFLEIYLEQVSTALLHVMNCQPSMSVDTPSV